VEKEHLLSIGRPQKLCKNCNSLIEEIERHPSILKTSGQGFERWDYCPECWGEIKDETYESFWITRRDVGNKKVRRLSRRERSCALRALFESLWERRETEEVGPHAFVLAHLLMKWGGLKWVEDIQDIQGGEIVVFEDPTTGDRIRIESVEIDDARALAIKEEVEAFLKQYAGDEEEIEL
jgi:hypothetical protein